MFKFEYFNDNFFFIELFESLEFFLFLFGELLSEFMLFELFD